MRLTIRLYVVDAAVSDTIRTLCCPEKLFCAVVALALVTVKLAPSIAVVDYIDEITCVNVLETSVVTNTN